MTTRIATLGLVLIGAVLSAAPLTRMTSVTSMTRAHDGVARIAVTVTRGSSPAVGLTVDDFVVVVDGSSVDAITVAPPLPLAVLVLVDRSESMAAFVERGANALDGQISGALKPGDAVRFGRVSNGVTIDPPIDGIASRDLRAAIRRWPDPPTFASSPLWDGVLQAARSFGDASHRHLITLVTDGRSTANHATVEEAAHAAVLAGAAVTIVDEGRTSVVYQDNRNPIAVRSSPALEWLSRLTGGRYYQDAYMLGRAYQPAYGDLIATAIRDQRFHYQLTFPVPDDGKFHELRVRVTEPGTTVYAATLVKGSGGGSDGS